MQRKNILLPYPALHLPAIAVDGHPTAISTRCNSRWTSQLQIRLNINKMGPAVCTPVTPRPPTDVQSLQVSQHAMTCAHNPYGTSISQLLLQVMVMFDTGCCPRPPIWEQKDTGICDRRQGGAAAAQLQGASPCQIIIAEPCY